MIERTLVVIKPDGVKRGLVGRIIQRFEDAGLKIIALKMCWIDAEFAKKHYKQHIDKPFYRFLEEYITSGPVIAMVLEGVHAVSVVRKIVGDTEPHKAMPGTIRGDFAHVSIEHANKSGKSVYNLIHASGNKKEAEEEIKLWFKESELLEYELSHEDHVR